MKINVAGKEVEITKSNFGSLHIHYQGVLAGQVYQEKNKWRPAPYNKETGFFNPIPRSLCTTRDAAISKVLESA